MNFFCWQGNLQSEQLTLNHLMILQIAGRIIAFELLFLLGDFRFLIHSIFTTAQNLQE